MDSINKVKLIKFHGEKGDRCGILVCMHTNADVQDIILNNGKSADSRIKVIL